MLFLHKQEYLEALFFIPKVPLRVQAFNKTTSCKTHQKQRKFASMDNARLKIIVSHTNCNEL